MQEKNNSTRTICTNCILPVTFPGISFDEQGVCNHCQRYRGKHATAKQKKKYEEKFLKLVKEKRKDSEYDAIVAFSGGKDSTYTLDLLVKRYKLRVLAATLDNTFVSPKALKNIAEVCGNLGVDNLLVRPNPNMLRKIFKTAAQQEIFSAKTLERASSICTSCITFVKGMVLRTALEKNIPFVGWGWSPGQAPIQASVMKTNAVLMKNTQEATFRPLFEIAGEAILPYFVTEKQFSQPEIFPWNVHPLAFLDYDEGNIIRRISEIGWEKPDDTDPNSSNCILNAYANYVHRRKYGFHPYVWEIANMVREGVMSREEGLEKIEPEEDAKMVDYSKNILSAS